MRKITIFVITMFLAVSLLFTEQQKIVKADGFSTSLDFNIPYDDWGDYEYKVLKKTDTYIFYKNAPYKIGFSQIEAGVFEYNGDSIYNLVIIQSTVRPYDVDMPTGWFGRMVEHDTSTLSVNLHSDIDNGFKNWGYGAYSSAQGYQIKSKAPTAVPTSDEFNIGVSVGGFGASGSTTIKVNELDVNWDHDTGSQIFDATYNYSCSISSCNYRNIETYNKGLYIIERSNVNYGTSGTFINTVYMDAVFYNATDMIWDTTETTLRIDLFY